MLLLNSNFLFFKKNGESQINKNPVKFARGLFSFLLISILLNQSRAAEPDPVYNSVGGGYEAFVDTNFQRGIIVKDENGDDYANLIAPFQNGTDIAWSLGQWGDKNLLDPAGTQYHKTGFQWQSSPGLSRRFSIEPFDDQPTWTEMKLDSSKSNKVAPWPTLILQQRVSPPNCFGPGSPFINEIDQLNLGFNSQLLKDKSEFGGGIGQFILNLTVQNLRKDYPDNPICASDPKKCGYGEIFWFQIPIFDTRYDFPYEYPHLDFANEKAIPIWPIPHESLQEIYLKPFADGSLHKVKVDLLPYINKAFNWVNSTGKLTSKSKSDYKIGGMNIGFEAPVGNVKMTFGFSRLSLQVINADYPRSFEWNSKNERNEWTIKNMKEIPTAEDKPWIFKSKQQNPHMISPNFILNTNKFQKIRVRMANNSPEDKAILKIYWKNNSLAGFPTSHSVNQKIGIGGGWKEYVIDLSSHPYWKGKINSLRVDPILSGDASNKAFGIDFIRFEP